MLQYKGTVKKVMETHIVSEKFKKREFVVSDNAAQYPQTVMFQVTQDRCDLFETIKEGDEVTIDFSLKGREWTNPQGEVKYFNTLDAFRVVVSK